MVHLAATPRENFPFAEALRRFRTGRRISQLELALACGISARHLSFLESARSMPSRDMVQKLAAGLRLPHAGWNALLHAAGFTPIYPASPLHAAALEPLRQVLAEMMTRHSPYPALLCDRHWNVLDANPAAARLLAALAGSPAERNVIRMMTDHPQAATIIANLPDMLVEMAGRLQLESLDADDDAAMRDLRQALAAAMARHPCSATPGLRRPLMPLIINTPTGTMRFLSAVAQFGTSQDVTVRDLRLELLFPADEETKKQLQSA